MRMKLTLLALLASVSFIAQAQTTPAAGNQPLNEATPSTTSPTTRSAVENKAAGANKAGTIAVGQEPFAPNAGTASSTTRAATEKAGTAALESGKIAVGDEPIVGSSNKNTASQTKSNKKVKQNKKKTGHSNAMSGNSETVQSGVAPFTKTPSATSDKSRSDVKSALKKSGGVDGVASGVQPVPPTPSTVSDKSRAAVEASGTAALKKDAIETGNKP